MKKIMNKELEALNDLINFIGSGEIANTHELCEYVAKRKDIIETALKEKENIESRIDEIFSNHNIKSFVELNERLCDYNELKFDDDIKQKKLKALEIIKKKRVECWLLNSVFLNGDKVEIYNELLKLKHNELTQEEYDLLKEVCCYDKKRMCYR